MSIKKDWKTTIRLPETDFPMRANLAERETETVERWKREGLYHRMLEARKGAPTFVFHDGPPYANGNIHHGHALNKILKDIVVKYRHLAGFQSTNIPGWDCHGLPIEHQVDEALGNDKRALSTVEFRRRCREHAQRFVEIQREEFRRLMILAEWERPYLTMSYGYEASTLREIGRFMEQGYVYNGLKPVHWSWAAVTALADAEVEYAPYVAPSVYVRFSIPEPPSWLAERAGGRAIDAVIWTTTPWTLAANLAICLGPDLEYELLGLDDGSAIIVAEGLKAATLQACRIESVEVLHSFKGRELVGDVGEPAQGTVARHPFIDRDSLLLPADYVTLEQGTGLVHTAPGHGAEDFATGQKYGLGILAPVNQYGKYTTELGSMGEFASGLQGLHVFKANPVVARHLFDTGRLLNLPDDTYRVERYPHCWRTRKPLIFRATAQWFISVEHNGLRERCLEAIGQTRWIPHWGEQRIRGMIEVRPDWCISRQRAWGVPIPAFTCGSCGDHVVSHEVANHVASLCETRGADVWFEEEAPALVPAGFVCPHCGAAPTEFEKVNDILDVWFDSGSSWAAVLRDREQIGSVADLYLEGSDQHRGWFHTSLLVAMGSEGHAPYRSVLTHGFVVDSDGHKYSKSSPNFEPLQTMLDQHGAEVLRAWVTMVDYRNDMVLAPDLLKQTSGAYRKIRNTMRFLLGSVSDFDPAAHTLELGTLTDIDRWALSRTAEFLDAARAAYEAYDFHAVFHAIYEFCNETLSAVYLDVLKDRLYCDDPTGALRIGSQSVLYAILRRLVVVVAPVLSFTADEVWGYMRLAEGEPSNVFLANFPRTPGGWRDAEVEQEFDRRLALRRRIQELIEGRRPKKKGERVDGQIGSSQEAVVTLTVKPSKHAASAAIAAQLAELAIVAEVRVRVGEPADPSGVDVEVDASNTQRCERCWNHRHDVGVSPSYPDLCGRCVAVVRGIS